MAEYLNIDLSEELNKNWKKRILFFKSKSNTQDLESLYYWRIRCMAD
jgi:hypothetical protein